MSQTMLAAIDAAFQAAVKAEVDSQLTEIRQHFANTVGGLATQVAALESKLAEAQLFQRTTQVAVQLDEARIADALDSQSWFWEKIRSYIDAGVEAATEDFVAKDDLPDFDEFLAKEDFPDADDIVTKDELPEFTDPDELVTKDELAELVRESLQGKSFTLRF